MCGWSWHHKQLMVCVYGNILGANDLKNKSQYFWISQDFLLYRRYLQIFLSTLTCVYGLMDNNFQRQPQENGKKQQNILSCKNYKNHSAYKNNGHQQKSTCTLHCNTALCFALQHMLCFAATAPPRLTCIAQHFNLMVATNKVIEEVYFESHFACFPRSRFLINSVTHLYFLRIISFNPINLADFK